jgi:hypothetical protein
MTCSQAVFKQKEDGKIKLIITVDTEEDNWANYSTTDNSVNNIEQLVPLQKLFDRYQVTSLWKKTEGFLAYTSDTNIDSICLSEITEMVPKRLDCY